MVEYYSNGTVDIILDYLMTSVAGSLIMFAVLILGVIFMLFLVTRMDPKFILLFSLPAIIGLFGYASEGSLLGSQYVWIIALMAVIVAFIIFAALGKMQQ